MGETQLFVYGTLKPGYRPYEQLCAPQVREVQLAIVLGQLYKLPMGYPALTLEGTQPVYGHLLSFADAAIFSVLDDYEQHDPQILAKYFPGQYLGDTAYQRQQVEVLSRQGTPLDRAWAYVMRCSQVERLQGVLCPSGHW